MVQTVIPDRPLAGPSPGLPVLLSGPEPHAARRRSLLAAHPEVRALVGRNPGTAGWIVIVGAGQCALAAVAAMGPWWWAFVMAYGIGALVTLMLWVLIHETSHDLVLRKTRANKLLGVAAGLPLGLPAAAPFRQHHLLHHRYQGDAVLDGDVASGWEVRWVGTSAVRKALWLLAMPVMQMLRPLRMQGVQMIDRWSLGGVMAQVAFDTIVIEMLGWQALAYLLLSNAFALGLHPLGGRWIQEHFLVFPGQETSSCYGWVNRLTFNAGYHVEHHDMPRVAWNRLPALRAVAPEMFDTLPSHRSWTVLLARFLFDPALGPGSRAVRMR